MGGGGLSNERMFCRLSVYPSVVVTCTVIYIDGSSSRIQSAAIDVLMSRCWSYRLISLLDHRDCMLWIVLIAMLWVC